MKQPSYLSLARELIAIESVKSNPKGLDQALDLCLSKLRDFTIEHFDDFGVKSALIYNQATRPSKFRLILGAHLDVVPAEPKQFIATEQKGRLYGRGAYDMKAAASVLVEIFALQANKVDYPVALQLVTDEEDGGHHGAKHQLTQGINSDFVILGEYSDLLINNTSKGLCWVKIRVEGEAAHGAYPWRGNNAANLLIEAISDIQTKHPTPQDETSKTTWNLSWVNVADKTKNRSSDSAEAFLDIRFSPEDSIFSSLDKERVKNYIQSLTKTNLSVDVQTLEAACHTESDHPDVRALKACGANGTLKTHGSSDLRFFQEHGIPGVCFGPKGANPHADNEYVELESLENYRSMLTQFVQQLPAHS